MLTKDELTPPLAPAVKAEIARLRKSITADKGIIKRAHGTIMLKQNRIWAARERIRLDRAKIIKLGGKVRP